MKKQFDLQYYLEHPETKVVTREGNNVRIICTDAMSEGTNKVVGLVLFDKNNEWALHFTSDGRFMEYNKEEYDLFFDLPDPNKKKVPLTYEDLLERVKAGKTMWIQSDTSCTYLSYFDQNGYICFGEAMYKIEELMKKMFADGTPCWKEAKNEEDNVLR